MIYSFTVNQLAETINRVNAGDFSAKVPFKPEKALYPGVMEAETEKGKTSPEIGEEPDFIGGAPNYEKFRGWSPEKVLSWLNID